MSTPNYLFDFKNITVPSLLDNALTDWKLTKISERTFELTGREYTRTDLISLYGCIGSDGHIFIFDYQTGDEFYLPKRPKGRKRDTARDSDLDSQTLQAIAEFQATQPD